MNENEKQDRNWAMACHLISLIGFLGIPFGHLIGPLTLWLAMKKKSPLMDVQGKESLNFQLSMTVYALIASVLVMLAGVSFLFYLVAITDVVLVIVAAVRTFQGEDYRYPFNLRLLR